MFFSWFICYLREFDKSKGFNFENPISFNSKSFMIIPSFFWLLSLLLYIYPA